MTTPIPLDKRDAIHARVAELQAAGVRDIYELAERLQDLWPGCTANQARGLAAGLKSKAMGGNRNAKLNRHFKRRPWQPSQPKPGART